MINSDKMFVKLGYVKSYTQLGNIEYYKDDDSVICFILEHKNFFKYDDMCDFITMQELQAINEKCKELGWY